MAAHQLPAGNHDLIEKEGIVFYPGKIPYNMI
jgi:hypothetical protein